MAINLMAPKGDDKTVKQAEKVLAELTETQKKQ
jgi:hypothetical protein